MLNKLKKKKQQSKAQNFTPRHTVVKFPKSTGNCSKMYMSFKMKKLVVLNNKESMKMGHFSESHVGSTMVDRVLKEFILLIYVF